ncbi:uncharacterized protein LOC111077185 [Drosophila obscura]|uniref:uncharacterized protein LOC111077185 n=1 Tax=Drosophila obscura TaxID=7282 RepID=UPI001BB2D00F|nr:uncharacterized protein LOC111077185 [Drosophila obscura]XP_022227045.2 uncharacterized protein LOC111077185 [Drosophila obscura]XP_022227046.2 uncharacterized protein LOC111077185 [Drosophila obscura]
MSEIRNQDERSEALGKKETDQDSKKEVELGDSSGQEEPLNYDDASVEELVEKWKQRSEERDCQYASIGLQSEKILAELSSISKQIKQIQISSDDDDTDNNQAVGDQAVGNKAVGNKAVGDQADDDQAVVGDCNQGEIYQYLLGDQDDDDKEEDSNETAADQWDAAKLFGYQGNAGQGDSDQDDAGKGVSSVLPEYFTF